MEDAGSRFDPRVRGAQPRFRHLDDADIPWQRIKSIQRRDGTVASVWEKWLAFSADPPYLSALAKWDPGMIIRRHGYFSNHVLFVIRGEMWCGDRHCPNGTHIELPMGAGFGPFVAGPEGTILHEVMMGDPRSWGEDRAAFQQVLTVHGATQLPDPMVTLPTGFADLPSRWTPVGDAR